jgi:hypothetical protein
MTNQQYLVTNIKFTNEQYGTISAGKNVVDKFKIPADTTDIIAWLADYNNGRTEYADKTAYALYVRTLLFNSFDITYDFQPIDPAVIVDNVLEQLYMVDVIDQSYADYKTARVKLDVPLAFIAELTADDLELHHNDVEQAIYENMIDRLELNINVMSVTDCVLELMADYMNEHDAPAPNSVSEAVYELIYELVDSETNSEDNDVMNLAEKISTGAFELSSDLVKDIGKYW